eukprot:2157046-Amphidinium_carterae.2
MNLPEDTGQCKLLLSQYYIESWLEPPILVPVRKPNSVPFYTAVDSGEHFGCSRALANLDFSLTFVQTVLVQTSSSEMFGLGDL